LTIVGQRIFNRYVICNGQALKTRFIAAKSLSGRDDDYLKGVPNRLAQNWLANRLYVTVGPTPAAIIQERVKLRFTIRSSDTVNVRPAHQRGKMPV
jgi:hypothetical protein